MKLDTYVKINKRYSRSINLERDFDNPNVTDGYILTEENAELLNNILSSIIEQTPNKCWTITALYGTGKSAFIQFITSICSKHDDRAFKVALNKVKKSKAIDSKLINKFKKISGPRGFNRAVATAQREPISNTIIRALYYGSNSYWTGGGRKPQVLIKLEKEYNKVEKGKVVGNDIALSLTRQIGELSQNKLLIIIDELGKSLEYTALNPEKGDIYLLQQIAELGSSDISFIGVLHQSFTDYSERLTFTQQNEWSKIQGRFIDIPFIKSDEHMFNLISNVLLKNGSVNLNTQVSQFASKWYSGLKKNQYLSKYNASQLFSVYPLHPVAACLLPILCHRFGQSDRSMFTFLTSDERLALPNFVSKASFENGVSPLYNVEALYDYFTETSGFISSRRGIFQKWTEIQGIINDSINLDDDNQKILKIIGALNLSGQQEGLNASRQTVISSLITNPGDKRGILKWEKKLDTLIKRGLITYRKAADEYRIWEGSDFDIQGEIEGVVKGINSPLSVLLSKFYNLKPIIAHKHSYKTGTLRYFKCIFIDEFTELNTRELNNSDADGLMFYYLGEKQPFSDFLKQFNFKKPYIIVFPDGVTYLRESCLEYIALRKIESDELKLQLDKVARRELRQRIAIAKQVLDNTITEAFNPLKTSLNCIIDGEEHQMSGSLSLNTEISRLCDQFYKKAPKVWNELVNRREITAQGSLALKILMEAMVENGKKESLGIEGFGPERSIYESLLREAGIHCQEDDAWGFSAPNKRSGLYHIWNHIENYFFSATNCQKGFKEIYEKLSKPPYGVRHSLIPPISLAILLLHEDDVSLYYQGTFIPIIKPDHIKLFIRRPELFSIKHYKLIGSQSKIFKELGKIFQKPKSKQLKLRNSTLLEIVSPLLRLVKSLPQYTLNTSNLDESTLKIRDALLAAKEPDKLLLIDLPRACGIDGNKLLEANNNKLITDYRSLLVKGLQKLQVAYEKLLEKQLTLLKEAFSISGLDNEFENELRYRATNLEKYCFEPALKSFIMAAQEERDSFRTWLESIVLIISDKAVNIWDDNDENEFPIKLSHISRKFLNLELIAEEPDANKEKGFEKRRLILTKPDGREISRIIWLNNKSIKESQLLTNKIIKNYNLDEKPELIQGIIANLIERTEKK